MLVCLSDHEHLLRVGQQQILHSGIKHIWTEVWPGADLLADLSASQLLAQADLTECNSPLKIVQIGGDDLFETDEATGNDYLLDTEAGLSPHT